MPATVSRVSEFSRDDLSGLALSALVCEAVGAAPALVPSLLWVDSRRP